MKYMQIPYNRAYPFCSDVFKSYGFSREESDAITDILLRADLCGIESHGIQRLIRYHHEITQGYVDVNAKPRIESETPLSAVIDAGKAMGQLVSLTAMKTAIEKAGKTGIGMVTVRNSNHFGIAGYYSQMAAEADLMGVSMTNTEAICVPTFGKRAMLGTNPIALAMPADPVIFSFDASTTVVTRGKLEVYNKNEKPLPDNWALDSGGRPTRDAADVLHNIIHKLGGGISPLGGGGELFGGHKGYGFALMVDLFTGILSHGKTSNHVNAEKGRIDTCHFFAAVDYGLFGDKAELKNRFSLFLQELRDSDKADGEERIYVHGEKEAELMAERRTGSFPINEKTWDEMRKIAGGQGVSFERYFPENPQAV